MVLHTRGRVGRRHFTTSLETRKRLGALLRLDESEGELNDRKRCQNMVRNGIRRHHKGKVERRTMAYTRCVLDSKENKRVIAQNG